MVKSRTASKYLVHLVHWVPCYMYAVCTKKNLSCAKYTYIYIKVSKKHVYSDLRPNEKYNQDVSNGLIKRFKKKMDVQLLAS